MAIQTYSFLMGRNIKGQKSQKGKEAPNFQSAILSNAAQLYHPKGVLKEAQRLIAFFSTSHPWNQRWHKLSFVHRAAQNNVGSSLLRSAAHLQDIARRHIKSKRRNYLRIASKLRQMQRTHFPAAKP